MAGMLQILTYLLSFYLVIKGVEILQIGLASSRENRNALILIGVCALGACVLGGFGFSTMQDKQAQSLQNSTSGFGQ